MHVNYLNLHKSIINNRLNEEPPNYSLQCITNVSTILHPQALIEYRSLTILTFVAFEKWMWIWLQSSMKWVYYYVDTTIPKTTHKSTIMIMNVKQTLYINGIKS